MSQTAAGIEERATTVKEVRHDSSIVHDLQAPAHFFFISSHNYVRSNSPSSHGFVYVSLSERQCFTDRKIENSKEESMFNRDLQA